MDLIKRIIPELKHVGNADNDLELKGFPNLKHIIQNSHASIDGTIKFKHFTVYAQPSMNANSLPTINSKNICSEFFIKEDSGKQFTHEEILKASKALGKFDFCNWSSCLSTIQFGSPLTLTICNDYTYFSG